MVESVCFERLTSWQVRIWIDAIQANGAGTTLATTTNLTAVVDDSILKQFML